jgi:hypothetical protein
VNATHHSAILPFAASQVQNDRVSVAAAVATVKLVVVDCVPMLLADCLYPHTGAGKPQSDVCELLW